MQQDQNIVRTCALHSLLQITHTTEEMKIVKLYQLPPLKDKKIHDTPGTGDDPNPVCLHQSLWQENFYFHELKHVVRQKNKHFAQLLNRVREANITEHNETTLKARVTTLDDPDHFTDALHVYGTNQQADQYNATMLQKLNTPKYVIQSSDITRDRHKAG